MLLKYPHFASYLEGHGNLVTWTKKGVTSLAPNVGPSNLAKDNRASVANYKGAEKLRKAILAAIFVYMKFIEYQRKFVSSK